MALKLNTQYPGRFDPVSTDYPQGKWRNRSSSTANDGGYLEEAHMNDIYGFFGALLRNAEIVPDGTVDTARKSQFYEALIAVAEKVVSDNPVDLSSYLKKSEIANEWGGSLTKVINQKFLSSENERILGELGLKLDTSSFDGAMQGLASEIRNKASIAYVDTSVAAVAGGSKSYKTLTEAESDKENIPSNSSVYITNDGELSGLYNFSNGVFTKSEYDPLTTSKKYTDREVSRVSDSSVYSYLVSNNNDISCIVTDALGVPSGISIKKDGSIDIKNSESFDYDDVLVSDYSYVVIDNLGVVSDIAINDRGSFSVDDKKPRVATFGSSTMSLMYGEINSLMLSNNIASFVLKGGIGNSRCESIIARTGLFNESITLSGSISNNEYVPIASSSWLFDKGMDWDFEMANGELVNIKHNATTEKYEVKSLHENFNISSEKEISINSKYGSDYDFWIINIGKNDLTAEHPTPDFVYEQTKKMADELFYRGKKYVVMNHYVNAGVKVNSPGKRKVLECNALLKDAFGRLLYDMQGYLMSNQVWLDTGITPTSEDLSEQSKENLAPSLTSDNMHLNNAANKAVARNLFDFITSRKLI